MALHHGLRAAAGNTGGGGGGGGGGSSTITDIRTEIAAIAGVLATNRATYTGNISNVYYYAQDGNNPVGNYIIDGGGDMFDNANFTMPWLGSNPPETNVLTNLPTAISYNTTAATTDGYTTWAATGYRWVAAWGGSTTSSTDVGMPNTVVGSTGNSGTQYSGWMKAGNSGADGSGIRAWRTLNTGTTVNGFTVHSADVTTYNTPDPGHCDFYISLGHTNWNSSDGGSVPTLSAAGSSGTHWVQSVYGLNSSSQNNIVHIAMLLAKRSGTTGQQPTTTELYDIVNDVTSHLKTHFGY